MRGSRCGGRRRPGERGTARARLVAPLAAVALVAAACSSGGSSQQSGTSPAATSGTSGASASSSGTRAAPPPGSPSRTIAITVRGKKVSPPPSRVTMSASDTLRLVITSDHDDELHAHGFDVEKPLVAGQPLTVDLTGAPPGLYDVETHEPELRLLQVVVQ